VARFTPDGVVFGDGQARPFEAVILATGYSPNIRELVDGADAALDAQGNPRRPTGDVDGLHFVGYRPTPTGLLRDIGLTTPRVAEAIVRARAKRLAS
jgi:hypothetical protein